MTDPGCAHDSTEAGPLARSSLEVGADPADWMYMRLVDYYEFNWYPMKGDPHGRYNLIVSVSHWPLRYVSMP